MSKVDPNDVAIIMSSPIIVNILVAWIKDLVKALLKRAMTDAELTFAKGALATALAGAAAMMLAGMGIETVIGAAAAAVLGYGGGVVFDAQKKAGDRLQIAREAKAISALGNNEQGG